MCCPQEGHTPPSETQLVQEPRTCLDPPCRLQEKTGVGSRPGHEGLSPRLNGNTGWGEAGTTQWQGEETDGPYPCSLKVAQPCRGQLVSSVSPAKLQIIFGKQGGRGHKALPGSQGQLGSFAMRCRPAPPALPPDPGRPSQLARLQYSEQKMAHSKQGVRAGIPRTSNSKRQPKRGPPSSCSSGPRPTSYPKAPVGNSRGRGSRQFWPPWLLPWKSHSLGQRQAVVQMTRWPTCLGIQ